MTMASHAVPPLLPNATPAQAAAILGAMRAVAEVGGNFSTTASRTIAAASWYVFGQSHSDVRERGSVSPAALASALEASPLGQHAMRFLAVMALVDGVLDPAKTDLVACYAAALGVQRRYLDDLAYAAGGHLPAALADMTSCNMVSITNQPWSGGDVNHWLMPYRDGDGDPALAGRFAALGDLAPDTLGHAMWAHFRENNYGFPGQETGLNAAFSLSHDTAHVLTGYDTSPRGEILVSTFTASMHPIFPIAGHVLPVLLSWHVGTRINDVAGDATGALDPEEFWHAWAGGAAAAVDTFAPGWDFWAFVDQNLEGLRARWSLPPNGLESAAE